VIDRIAAHLGLAPTTTAPTADRSPSVEQPPAAPPESQRARTVAREAARR